ncbi:hypothetical protein [Pseudonocardia sp. ICBG601]|uniref:hypothetical protein n=1 Tax=Pseudonocardia sp. ICBG601 TaxID=2846759 RepID=UPI001CF70F3D|nr:hypothetical protein [Pseudonocardia sp. ICBG601]
MGKKKQQRRTDPSSKARRRAQRKARDNDLPPFPGRDADHGLGLGLRLIGTIVVNADYHQHDDGTWTATVAPELLPGAVTIDDVDLHTVFHKVIAVVEVLAQTAPPDADISTITLHRVDGDTLRWLAAVDEYGFTDCVNAAQFSDH